MNGAIANQPKEYYSYIMAPTFKRTRTMSCESDALTVVCTYKRYGQITEEECKAITKQIKAAPHDDAISNIMSRLRRRVYG